MPVGSTNMSVMPRISSLDVSRSSIAVVLILNSVRRSILSCDVPYIISNSMAPSYLRCWMARGCTETKCSGGPVSRGPPLLLRSAITASPETVSRNLMSTKVCDHSSLRNNVCVCVCARPLAFEKQHIA